MGGEAALSVEARYLEPELPIELDDAYTHTFDRLRRMFRARGCTPEEAADLAQEAAIRAFVHIRRWGVTNGGLDPLLNRIARNLLIDRYRRVAPHLVPLDSAGDLHDPAQDPTEEFARRQRGRDVHHAIRSLPSRHQAAITYSLSGMSPEEVGRQMGIGRNAADALLHRARRSLKEHLEPVREGMWGVALAIRVRYDRVMRRVGVQPGAAEASGAVLSNSAVGVATVVMVVAVTLGGGGAGDGASFASARAATSIPVEGSSANTPSSITSSSIDGAAPAVPGSGGPGGSVRLGPTTTTNHGGGDFSNEFSVPDPENKNGPPLLKIEQYVCLKQCPMPADDTQQDLVGRTICGLSETSCRIWSPRDA